MLFIFISLGYAVSIVLTLPIFMNHSLVRTHLSEIGSSSFFLRDASACIGDISSSSLILRDASAYIREIVFSSSIPRDKSACIREIGPSSLILRDSSVILKNIQESVTLFFASLGLCVTYNRA